MKKLFIFLSLIVFTACATQKSAENISSKSGNDRTKKVEFIDNQTYLLTEYSNDNSYGFTQENPVKVGGVSEGPRNERRFLNALTGPNGEEVGYFRVGSCCSFKTPNGYNGLGLLDNYKVYYKGIKDTVNIYINMYDEGDLKIPVGFKAKSSDIFALEN